MRRKTKEQERKNFVVWYLDLPNPLEVFVVFWQRHFADTRISHQEFENKPALLKALKTKRLPDLLLTHLQLYTDSDPQPGVELVKLLRKYYPALKIVIFSDRGDEYLQEALAGIADYYLDKTQLWELELIIVCLALGYDFQKITQIIAEIRDDKKKFFPTELKRLHKLLKAGHSVKK